MSSSSNILGAKRMAINNASSISNASAPPRTASLGRWESRKIDPVNVPASCEVMRTENRFVIIIMYQNQTGKEASGL